MGAWGHRIFDNDLAADVRDGLVAPLKEYVAEYFATTSEQISLEDFEEEIMGEVLPRVALLLALCEHCGGVPPLAEEVSHWHVQYQQQEASVGESDEAYHQEAEQVFVRLEQLAQDFHQNTPEGEG
jgi:hypothetical protein